MLSPPPAPALPDELTAPPLKRSNESSTPPTNDAAWP